jgi:hypothetical protein
VALPDSVQESTAPAVDRLPNWPGSPPRPLRLPSCPSLRVPALAPLVLTAGQGPN